MTVMFSTVPAMASSVWRIDIFHQTYFQQSVEVFAAMTPHQKDNDCLERYQAYTLRGLADPAEHSLILIHGLHSLDPSCPTMSSALCKAHN